MDQDGAVNRIRTHYSLHVTTLTTFQLENRTNNINWDLIYDIAKVNIDLVKLARHF